MNYQPLLEKIRREIEIYAKDGKQADYIPALANVNPDQFGICLNTLDGRSYCLGDSDVKFHTEHRQGVLSRYSIESAGQRPVDPYRQGAFGLGFQLACSVGV